MMDGGAARRCMARSAGGGWCIVVSGATGYAARRYAARGVGVLAGAIAAFVLPELPTVLHPTALFGRLMQYVERVAYRPSRIAGTLYGLAGVVGVTILGMQVDRSSRTTGTAVSVGVCTSAHELYAAAERVGTSLGSANIESAHRELRALVGRDTEGLSQVDLVRAAIESVAENTVDAIIAPIFYGILAGTPGVVAYRAINTLDAMVGYRNARYADFGWFSARLDDYANWVPARLAVLATAISVPRRARHVVQQVLSNANEHPSPNAGIIEAAFAAALGIRLGGVNYYDGMPVMTPVYDGGRAVCAADIQRAVTLSRKVSVLGACISYALVGVCATAFSAMAISGEESKG
ncbi:MAG: adenosylcobinamide-phosphate synthase CbiB [Actinobacteria bacterium]|nr:adenosylcobinamide-phosphate synthase CbiB [Actinomycetota bacterium]MCL5446191.1 adenosylcobinamide-phosphate synthase CbiB [Actinomycetota bacterium]